MTLGPFCFSSVNLIYPHEISKIYQHLYCKWLLDPFWVKPTRNVQGFLKTYFNSHFSSHCEYQLLLIFNCIYSSAEQVTLGLPTKLNQDFHVFFWCLLVAHPIGSMCIYIPTFTIKNQPNVGKYTRHGSWTVCLYVRSVFFSFHDTQKTLALLSCSVSLLV